MKRSSKSLLLLGLAGPTITFSCSSVLGGELRDLGISLVITVAEVVAFDLAEQITGLDLDGSDATTQ